MCSDCVPPSTPASASIAVRTMLLSGCCAVSATLAAIRETAATEPNLMPALLEAARAHATEGEIVEALQDVWGSYTETPVF